MRTSYPPLILAILLSTTLASSALAQAANPQPLYTVDIQDLTPRFLDFYQSAQNATPDERWLLWKQKYNFAAVPPIPAGQQMARDRLDASWSKYPAAISRIEPGADGLQPPPQVRLIQVANLLGANAPVHIKLIVFVGTFNRNAFAMGLKDGVSTIAIPLEDSDQDHALDMTHEFTHAVQMQLGGWDRQDVASAIFTEGLAMHTTERIYPGLAPNIYTASSPAWFEQCSVKLPAILAELKLHLDDAGAQAVSKFTFGTGTAGIEREVYCGGWFLIARMLDSGATFQQLAHLTQSAAREQVRAAINKILDAPAKPAPESHSTAP